jgi:Telomere resolvase
MRKWLQALVDEYLPAVADLQGTPEDQAQSLQWATWMRQQWAAHGMAELKQQRNLMTDVRGAIKAQLGENHLALESMNFTVAEWTMINTPIADQVARRNENVVLLDNSEAIVAQAVRLLEQREWAEVAAGLVVLTGRRSSEILGTANFRSKSQWSVTFTGALKRRGEAQILAFEIPTLTTADRVITALAKLRQMCPTEGLSAEQINQKYAQAVATACDRHFSNLVPHRDGRDNLFTHLFRSVYAAIATHWYAPPTVDANEYKAAIQGHYAILEATDDKLRRSLAASRHYNDYKIGDRTGNIDGRQGIKLGYGGVEVIDVFNKSRQGTTFQLEVTPSLVDQHSDDLEVTAMDTIQEVSTQVIESVSEALEALPEIEPKKQPEDSIVSKRRQPRRVKPVAVDLELLKTVTGRFDIEIRSGKGQGGDSAAGRRRSLSRFFSSPAPASVKLF